jgi:hypothetical protein
MGSSKKKVFSEFNRRKHVVQIPPSLLAAANDRRVLIATPKGFYALEKVEPKNGVSFERVVVDEMKS